MRALFARAGQKEKALMRPGTLTTIMALAKFVESCVATATSCWETLKTVPAPLRRALIIFGKQIVAREVRLLTTELAGAASVAYGIHLISTPAAFIVGGIAVIVAVEVRSS